jgi:putative FmdB family regulatory protein
MLREFKCERCGYEFEELQRSKDEKIKCPKCDAEVEYKTVISLSTYGKNSSWPVR